MGTARKLILTIGLLVILSCSPSGAPLVDVGQNPFQSPVHWSLSVSITGTGIGGVISQPGPVNCSKSGGACQAKFVNGTVVTLTATPKTGSLFVGFSGDADCADGSVALSGNITCTASFALSPGMNAINVIKDGLGIGAVTSNPAGIDCGNACQASFVVNTVVTLTAIPEPGSFFVGFTGGLGCTDGSVTLTETISCTATFTKLTVVTISVGDSHTCALISDRTIKCWGSNSFGALGNNTNTSSLIPVITSGIKTATNVSAGSGYTCALLLDATVSCWGKNDLGTLGNDTITDALIPIMAKGIANARDIATRDTHTCTLFLDGTVSCWGVNSYGQLGNATTTDSLFPVMTKGIAAATSISAGREHTCVVVDKKVTCWGSNVDGQIGNGDQTGEDALSPVNAFGITTATSVSAGATHTCAVLVDGKVKCWGSNATGQLGKDDIITDAAFRPVSVSGIGPATSVSAGATHTCAVLIDGTVWCWGENVDGQLGNDSDTDSWRPVMAKGITTAKSVSAGATHTCAVLMEGSAKCWGDNAYGQLGNGSITSSFVPIDVIGLP